MDERYRGYFAARWEQEQSAAFFGVIEPPGMSVRLEQTGPGPTATGPTSSGPRFSQLRFDVRQTIDGAAATAQEAGKILRDDARLLLLFAFNELVARPISTVRPGTENLEEYIDSDIRAITSRAIELSETDEVSAHNIVDATSGSWDSLLTAQFSIWD